MIDLFEYASKHNMYISVAPLGKHEYDVHLIKQDGRFRVFVVDMTLASQYVGGPDAYLEMMFDTEVKEFDRIGSNIRS